MTTRERTMEEVAYAGWAHCLRLANAHLELVATTDVGPRIIRFGAPGAPNLFKEYAEQAGLTGGDEWRLYGGHRLWHAPEAKPRTYWPDNGPVAHEWDEQTLKLIQTVEPTTHLQKEIEITLEADAPRARVLHRLINRGSWPVTTAPWALSVMAPGGRAVFPQEPYRAHTDYLLPARPLVLWHYTDMRDPRWSWGARFLQLRQDPEAATPQKLGMLNRQGWAAYTLGDQALLKRYGCAEGAAYPDFGCNTEMFTNGEMLEVETLGPLAEIPPGGAAEHVEEWTLLDRGLPEEEDALARDLLPAVAAAARA